MDDFEKRLKGFRFHMDSLVNKFQVGFATSTTPGNLFTKIFRRFVKVKIELKLADLIQKDAK